MVRGLGAVVVALLVIGLVSAVAHARRDAPTLAAVEDPSIRDADDHTAAWGLFPSTADAERGVAFLGLRPLRIFNINTDQSTDLRLYDIWGNVDESAAKTLDALLGDARDRNNVQTTVLDRRTLQLVFRAAYHFRAKKVVIISAYRRPGVKAEGQHALGKAIDFKLPNVSASVLASYLRALPRVGVGVYTHPETQYVHVDDRDRSYHWIDASPPGRKWRERQIGAGSKRDATYSSADDWPEGTRRPVARASVL